MAEDPVEAIRRVYDEWGKGNWRQKWEIYSDDMEWGWSDEFPGLAGVYHDPAERNERLREWLGPWQHWRCEAEDFVVNGHVVKVTRVESKCQVVGSIGRPDPTPPASRRAPSAP